MARLLQKTTPDGTFTVTIRSRAFTDDEEDVPGTSMLQLVHLLEQTAQTLRLAVDPDLQKTPMKRPLTKEKDLKVPGAYRVTDADGGYVGSINPGTDGWHNFRVVDAGLEPHPQHGPFQTVEAAFAAFPTVRSRGAQASRSGVGCPLGCEEIVCPEMKPEWRVLIYATCVGSPTAGTLFISPSPPDNEFAADTSSPYPV